MIPAVRNGQAITPAQATRGAKGLPKKPRATPPKPPRATPAKTNTPQDKPRTGTGRFK